MKLLKSISIFILSFVIVFSGISVFSAKNKIKAPKLTVKNSSKGVKISWAKRKGAVKYKLYYKKEGSSKYKKAYSGKMLKYTAAKLTSGVKYSFKIKVKTKKNTSAFSKPSEIVFLKQPKLSAEEKLDMAGIHLSWKKVKGAQGYRIYRSLKYKNSYKKITTLKGNSTLYYFDKSVKDKKTPTQINSYKYYIKAYKGSYSSAKSKVKSEIYGYYENNKTPLYLTIKKGQVFKDINTKLKDNNAQYMFTWKSSDKKIAKVSDIGVITGVKKGKATITAKTFFKDKTRNIKIIVTVK